MNMNEEIICDFKVTKERKRLWSIQLDMLVKFHQLCIENNLKYFLCGGSLIGAVRHNGYIPWDDDIDVGMLRDDYEKFLRLYDKYFNSDKYFLCSSKTERLYPNGHAQIRNIHTAQFTRYEYGNLKAKKCCGVFIDIFPFDLCDIEMDEQKKKIKKLKDKVWRYVGMRFYTSRNPMKNAIKKCLLPFMGPEKKYQQYAFDIDKVSSKFNDGTKNYLGAISFGLGGIGDIYPKEWMGEVELHKFEDYNFYILKHFDDVLSQQYGDYMKFPKDKNINGSIHGDCYFDFDKSYKEYQNISINEFESLFNIKCL